MDARIRRGIGILVILGVLATLVVFAFGPMARAGMLVVFVLDVLTSADWAASVAPVMWALWGAVIGGAIGMWMIGTSGGPARRRPLVVALPVAAMLLLSALTHVW